MVAKVGRRFIRPNFQYMWPYTVPQISLSLDSPLSLRFPTLRVLPPHRSRWSRQGFLLQKRYEVIKKR